MFNDINSTTCLRSRLYNIGLRVLSNQKCGALETSDTLLGIPLYGTDPQTTIRCLDVNIYCNRRVKSKFEMSALDPNSTDIYYDSWIENVYPARPDGLQDMNLFDFLKDYDLVNTRPVSNEVEYYVLANKKYLKNEIDYT